MIGADDVAALAATNGHATAEDRYHARQMADGIAATINSGETPTRSQLRLYESIRSEVVRDAFDLALSDHGVHRDYHLARRTYNAYGSDLPVELPEPTLGAAVRHGPLGAFLELVEGQTEGPLAAVGISVLARLGTLIGRRVVHEAKPTRHSPNLYAAIVGPSSEGGKGVADLTAMLLIDRVEPAFRKRHHFLGLGSGQVLVRDLSDDIIPQPDKRKIVSAVELSEVLRVIRRDGSILGDILRAAFDGVPLGNRTVSNTPVVASNYHLSVLGSITPLELRDLMDDLSIANGLGNRFLYLWSRITNLLPFGGDIPRRPVDAIADEIKARLNYLDRFTIMEPWHLPMADDGRALWAPWYNVHRTGIGDGATRTLTARNVAHADKLAMIYAVLDGADAIHVPHLRAAFAWCDYSTATIRLVFGEGLSKRERALLAAVRDAGPEGMTGSGVNEAVSSDWPPGALKAVRSQLEQRGLIVVEEGEPGPKGGRPPVMYRMT